MLVRDVRAYCWWLVYHRMSFLLRDAGSRDDLRQDIEEFCLTDQFQSLDIRAVEKSFRKFMYHRFHQYGFRLRTAGLLPSGYYRYRPVPLTQLDLDRDVAFLDSHYESFDSYNDCGCCDVMRRAWLGLGKEVADVARLFYFDGYTSLEIAKLRGLTRSCVESRLNRCRLNFRVSLSECKQCFPNLVF
jgi:hypothetical protein